MIYVFRGDHSMVLHGVECERTGVLTTEAYVCRWADRNKLAMGLLGEGKATKTMHHDGIPDIKGIMGREFAIVQVESYASC